MVCKVCQEDSSPRSTTVYPRYRCPRCNVPYCSIGCFEAHSESCFSRFRQRQELDKLATTAALSPSPLSEISQKRLAETLWTLYRDETDDILAERADEDGASIDLEPLHIAIRTGQAAELVELWTPWWTEPHWIQEICDKDKESTDSSPGKATSAGARTRPSPARIRSASPVLGFHVVNVLYGYCAVLRHFNGEWESDPADFAEEVSAVAEVLAEDPRMTMSSMSIALRSGMERLLSRAELNGATPAFAEVVVRDVSQVLHSRTNLVRALDDLAHAFSAAKRIVTSSSQKDTLARIRKKCEFLLEWSASLGNTKLGMLQNATQLFAEQCVQLIEGEEGALRGM
uniref:HIT-type domain-containing protein n=1 Tax=Compsopogon caeruleus TaxID=31354 RepID=A0A7S1XFB9_9RHOD|mmetsp:Transcript_3171/g.6006  ORF Transcript_3171/g.6006 Transcript_3171/m.6006 type:complete len:343 (+) Transcript_3171:90-1118(+)